MTGTASEMYEFNDTANSDLSKADLSKADLLSAWLFGKINTNCKLTDLDRQGCTILVPKYQSMPGETFKLIIMSPENSEHVHTTVNAEQIWLDQHFSTSHIKIAARFKNLEQYLLQEINLLLSHIRMMDNHDIKCSILKR